MSTDTDNLRLHFLTFGNRDFYGGCLSRLAAGARRLGFDRVHAHDETTVPPDFMFEHARFIHRNRRGYGYWLWKPYLVRFTLREMRDGDVLVYTDAGCVLNDSARGREALVKAVQAARAAPNGMLAFATPHAERDYTKPEVLRRLEVPPEACASHQLIATGFVICKTPASVAIVDEWWRLATEDGYRLLDDSGGFSAHRHDQSLFSCLRKLRGQTTVWEDPTYPPYKDPDAFFYSARVRG